MKRERFFWLVIALLPIGFFVGLEASLRAANYGPDLSLFVAAPAETGDLRYLGVNPGVTQRYFPPGYFAPDTSGDLFLETKPDNDFRVFVLGGSTTAGWPHPANASFPRLLELQLAARLPGHRVEVINTAITAVNSHTMLDFIDEILEQEPDLVLIYGGHNEFYGALGTGSTISFGDSRFLKRTYLWLQRLRITALVNDVISRVRAGSEPGTADTEALRQSPTLMSQVIGDREIFMDSPGFRRAEDQFQANLDDIAARAAAAGVPVVLSELVSNVRDQAPFVSPENADETGAAVVYARGLQALADGDADAARALLYEAKDLDLLRFRAPEAFNDVIRGVAAANDLPLVPMQGIFESAATNGLIGSELMLEHLHPNSRGLLLMSCAFLATIAANGLAPADLGDVGDPVASLESARRESTLTELDDAIARIRVLQLTDHWPFKPESESSDAVNRYKPVGLAENLAKRIFADQTSVELAHVRMAEYYATRGDYDLAMREYEAIVDMAPLVVENYYRIADVLTDAGTPVRALPFLERSLEIKTDVYALKRIGQIRLFNDDADAAIVFLERAREIDVSDTELSRTLAYAYLADGRRDLALSIVRSESGSEDEAVRRAMRYGERLRTRFAQAGAP